MVSTAATEKQTVFSLKENMNNKAALEKLNLETLISTNYFALKTTNKK